MKPIFYILSLTLSLQLAAQNRLYVNQTATGANNGASWADAFTDLHSAFAAAQTGDSIWVAEGEYRPTSDGNRDSFFFMPSGVRLYGGFAGTETDLSERDWEQHPTVLSGDIGIAGYHEDNSFNILVMSEAADGTLFDGLTFRRGGGEPLFFFGDPYQRNACGGAVHINAGDGVAYPVFRNCRFEHNYARFYGGAVFVRAAADGSMAAQFLGCTFEDNNVFGDGGAVYCSGFVDLERIPDFGRCTFTENRAGRFGKAVLYQSFSKNDTLQYYNCKFYRNGDTTDMRWVLENHSGNHSRFDSCVFDGNLNICFRNNYFTLSNRTQTVHLTNSHFLNGLTFDAYGDSVCIVKNCVLFNTLGGTSARLDTKKGYKIEVTDCVVDSCAISIAFNSYCATNADCEYSNLIIRNNRPYSNYAGITAFSVGYNSPNIRFYNIDVVNNDSIHFYSPSSVTTSLFFNHLNFIGNKFYDHPTNPQFTPVPTKYRNSIFFENEEPYNSFSTYPSLTFSNCYLDSLNCAALPNVTCGPGLIIGGDPMFVNPDSGDYRLQPCSPLRDAGNNAYAAGIPTDIAGSPRIQGGTVDMGAYETPAFGLAAEPDIKAACAGQPTGSIIAPLDGACEPLSVAWQSGAQSGTSLNGLAPGSYSVTLTDAQGRSLTFSASIPVAPSPTLQVDGSPVSCFGAADAVLAVMPLTGKAPFAYLWSPSGETDSVATGLGPGPASVTVTDAWGCSATFAFNVPQPDTLQFSAFVQDASTPQSADGSVTVTSVTGGTAPYGYLWQPGGSMESMISNLSPGFYTLTVTDERGCEAAWTFEVKAIIGTKEAAEQAILVIYPNPASDAATVSFSGANISFIEIYDAAGRLMRSEKVSQAGEQWQIPLEGLAAGGYAVVLKNEAGKVVGRGRLMKG